MCHNFSGGATICFPARLFFIRSSPRYSTFFHPHPRFHPRAHTWVLVAIKFKSTFFSPHPRSHPLVGTLGLSVRVNMKPPNSSHAKRHPLYVSDIPRTLRPRVPTGGLATWRRMNAVFFIGVYGTNFEYPSLPYTELTLTT